MIRHAASNCAATAPVVCNTADLLQAAAAAAVVNARAPLQGEAPRPVLTPVLTAKAPPAQLVLLEATAGTQAALSDWMPRVIRQPLLGRRR
jgi:hypothetical protein